MTTPVAEETITVERDLVERRRFNTYVAAAVIGLMCGVYPFLPSLLGGTPAVEPVTPPPSPLVAEVPLGT